ncbi:lytic transglycosylase [Burkholderia multivorans]|uniref:transglycosylase SLT domain-containing protein n=1 Tax=Burkholderia TaxID=32008 RepID=UPI000277E290|nr:transglycosylase SLT domain-containing protein [Burkholderia multivorans]EJO51336.1 transglycosylase SLT domain protein [Burkholderia multivorans CF2]MBJ9654357.1 transglycosylase SLT domain-containing protein [Burkholderia multivorans]MBR8047377.1 transglycosylase SLT domain-containing protein [Burkholderia multivorans]MBR8122517.1 transglycosylase SLT domain-containing protein [Burkholderia multivorans]MBU9165086.1 transglycosylase SLT domain-containing protein [Burkholderia multivorans]
MIARAAFALAFALAASYAQSAVIAQVISPVSVVIQDGQSRRVAMLPGKPVYYCGLDAFTEWASPLVGQPVRSSRETGITVSIDGRDVALDDLFIDRGWLQPPVLDDGAQAALVERRGGWACSRAVVPFELLHTNVDPKILAGIALNESNYRGHAWPWTLNVAGQGYFFKSREEAYKAIESLLARDRCDFDVGLMQVNWCYHGKRFASAWDALAPATNVAVAEAILTENFARTDSVAKAVAYYHSANPNPGRAYLARFVQHLSMIEAGL